MFVSAFQDPDYKIAFVTLPPGQTFQYPDLKIKVIYTVCVPYQTTRVKIWIFMLKLFCSFVICGYVPVVTSHFFLLRLLKFCPSPIFFFFGSFLCFNISPRFVFFRKTRTSCTRTVTATCPDRGRNSRKLSGRTHSNTGRGSPRFSASSACLCPLLFLIKYHR